MLVVADSSPLIALIHTGYIDILPQLYGRVIIPLKSLQSWHRITARTRSALLSPPHRLG
jgi:predicted nucleic acid-binding protein